jgi:ABC-type Na+ transport system ATPase subunit NatA
MLGENGTGKTTFIRMLAGLMKSDEQEAAERLAGEDKEKLAVAAAMGVSLATCKRRLDKAGARFADAAKDHPALASMFPARESSS